MVDRIGIGHLAVRCNKILAIDKPPNHLIALKEGWFVGDAGLVAAPGILHRMAAKAVVNRVVVDIQYQIPKIFFAIDLLPFEGFNEE